MAWVRQWLGLPIDPCSRIKFILHFQLQLHMFCLLILNITRLKLQSARLSNFLTLDFVIKLIGDAGIR